MQRHLDVFAQLSLIAGDGAELLVHADKDIVSLTLPNLRIARRLFKQVPTRGNRTAALAHLQEGLKISDLTLHIKISHHLVAQLSPRSRSTFIARLLGLEPMEFRLLALLRAALTLSS
jgi:hypothetical protein